jgi:hypothetical protein
LTILLISLIIVSIILTVVLYRKNPVFIPVRIAAIVLLALLIFNVALPLRQKKAYTPPLLLRDHSASMAAHTTIITATVAEIKYPHVVVYFSESLYTQAPEDTATLGKFTNITGALRESYTSNPSSIIVISDGNHNVNADPLSQIETPRVPVHCFGIGRESRRDALLTDVVYPEYAYAGDSVHVQVTVQSAGFETGTGTVELQTKGGAMLQRMKFPLSTVRAKNTVAFTMPVEGLGEKTFRLVLKPLSAEHSYENNETSFSVHVLEEKLNVLYYTEHISFTTKFLLQILRASKRLNVTPVVQLTQGSLRNANTQREVSLPSLAAFDVVIFDNIRTRHIPWSEVEEFLGNGGGILCIGTLENQTAQWREILPIAAHSPVAGNHQLTIVEPFSILSPYDEYPPLATINRVTGVKQDAVVIAETNKIPVIAYRTHAHGVVFQINTSDIGTWHFLMQGMKREDVLSDLIADIVRFIAPSGHSGRLMLSSLRNRYYVGDIVDATLQSFDRDYRHAGGGDFFMKYDTSRIPFFEVQKGIYKATFIADKPGTYSLTARGKLHQEELASNELNLTIHAGTIESDQGLNKEFLEAVARTTGGTYAHFDEFSSFKPPPPQEQHIVRTFYLDKPITYILIVLVLAVEWFMRRKRGTL